MNEIELHIQYLDLLILHLDDISILDPYIKDHISSLSDKMIDMANCLHDKDYLNSDELKEKFKISLKKINKLESKLHKLEYKNSEKISDALLSDMVSLKSRTNILNSLKNS